MNLKIKDIVLTKWDDEKLCPPNDAESIFNQINLLKNLASLSETFDIIFQDEQGNEIEEWYADTGIVNNWIIACQCLAASQFSPALLYASIAVECVINRDSRLQSFKNQSKKSWLNLTNNETLKKADEVGIPVDLLCDTDENINDSIIIRFIQRRNKIAHGDYSGYGKIPTIFKLSEKTRTSYSVQPTLEHALYQIEKSKNFIIKWAQSIPSPVIIS